MFGMPLVQNRRTQFSAQPSVWPVRWSCICQIRSAKRSSTSSSHKSRINQENSWIELSSRRDSKIESECTNRAIELPFGCHLLRFGLNTACSTVCCINAHRNILLINHWLSSRSWPNNLKMPGIKSLMEIVEHRLSLAAACLNIQT